MDFVRQVAWASEFTYVFTISTVKLSIWLFYHRVFSHGAPRSWRLASHFVLSYIVAWWLPNWLVAMFQCSPVDYFWTRESGNLNGHCIDSISFYYWTAGLNILADVMLLVLPIPLVWRLQMVPSKKIAVSIIFLCGGL